MVPNTIDEKAIMLLQVTRQGKALSVIVPKEIAANMQADDRDILFATNPPSGYELSAYDPIFFLDLAASLETQDKNKDPNLLDTREY